MSSTEYKVVILGESGIGKTSLVNRLNELPFETRVQSTIGSPKKKFKLSEREDAPDFLFYDTAGDRKWEGGIEPSLRTSQGGDTHVVIIALDMLSPHETNKQSLAKLRTLVQQDASAAHLMVVLTKSDLSKVAQTREADVKAWLSDDSIPVIETSSKELLNINDVKEVLLKTCVASAEAIANQPPPPVEKTYNYSIRDLWRDRHNVDLLKDLASAESKPLISILKPQLGVFKIGLVNAVLRFLLLKTKDFQEAACTQTDVYLAIYFPRKNCIEMTTPKQPRIVGSHSRFIQQGFTPVSLEIESEEDSDASDYGETARPRRDFVASSGFAFPRGHRTDFPPVAHEPPSDAPIRIIG